MPAPPLFSLCLGASARASSSAGMIFFLQRGGEGDAIVVIDWTPSGRGREFCGLSGDPGQAHEWAPMPTNSARVPAGGLAATTLTPQSAAEDGQDRCREEALRLEGAVIAPPNTPPRCSGTLRARVRRAQRERRARTELRRRSPAPPTMGIRGRPDLPTLVVCLCGVVWGVCLGGLSW